MSHEIEHSESEFYYPEHPMQNYFSRELTHSEIKERNLTLLANEEAHNFLGNQQANRRSRKQLFRGINCPIITLSNKQTVGETSFWHQRIHHGSKERKPKK